MTSVIKILFYMRLNCMKLQIAKEYDPQCRYRLLLCVMIELVTVGGGVGLCVLISKSRTAAQITFADIYCSLEMIAFDLLNVTPALRIFIVYRPPYYDTNAELYADMLSLLSALITASTGTKIRITLLSS